MEEIYISVAYYSGVTPTTAETETETDRQTDSRRLCSRRTTETDEAEILYCDKCK